MKRLLWTRLPLLALLLALGCGPAVPDLEGLPTNPQPPGEPSGTPDDGTKGEDGRSEEADDVVEEKRTTAEPQPAITGQATPREALESFQQDLAARRWQQAASRLSDSARKRWACDLLAHARGIAVSSRDDETSRSLQGLLDDHDVDSTKLPSLVEPTVRQTAALGAGTDPTALAEALIDWIDEHPVDEVPPLRLSSWWQGHLDVSDPVATMAVGIHTAPPLSPQPSSEVTLAKTGESWFVDPYTSMPGYVPRPPVSAPAAEPLQVDLSTPAAAAESHRRSLARRDWASYLTCLDEPSRRVRVAEWILYLNDREPIPRLESAPDFDLREVRKGETEKIEAALAALPNVVAVGAEIADFREEQSGWYALVDTAPTWAGAVLGEPVVDEDSAFVPVRRPIGEFGSLTGRFLDEEVALNRVDEEWYVDLPETRRRRYDAPQRDEPHPSLVLAIPVEQAIGQLAFSPDGNTLYGVAWGEITAWDVESGKKRWSSREQRPEEMAVSPDGKTVALGTNTFGPSKIWLLDATDGSLRHQVGLHDKGVADLDFLSDGTLVSFAHDRTIRFWDTGPPPKESHRIDVPDEFGDGFGDAFTPLAGGKQILHGSMDPSVIDVESGDVVRKIDDIWLFQTSVREDGKLVVAESMNAYDADGLDDVDHLLETNYTAIRVIDPESGESTDRQQLLRTPAIGRGRAMTTDGRLLFLACTHEVLVYDMRRRRLVDVLGAHTRRIASMALSPDGALLATGPDGTLDEKERASRGSVRLWRVPKID